MNRRSIYLESALAVMPRIISMLDRNCASATYGCFDRRYWSWRMADMPNASLQYGIYPLALVYSNQLSDNPYYKNSNVREWLLAAIRYWMNIQHRNGSLDQFFPFEQSVGTTHYVLSAVLYSREQLKNDISADELSDIDRAIDRAARFVLRHDETYAIISNHLALYTWVLLQLAELRHDDRFRDKAEKYLTLILANQSAEGWHREYSGADPGYQSQCIYYLAECYRLTRDKKIRDSINRSIKGYLQYCFHPDGSFGGEYGSRGTEIIYPAGFEYLRLEIELGNEICTFIRNHRETGRLTGPAELDDENAIRLTTNHLQACLAVSETIAVTGILPCHDKAVTVYLKDAGLLVHGNERYYCLVGINQGGIIKVFDRTTAKPVFADNGYAFLLKNGTITTNHFAQCPAVTLNNNAATIRVDCFETLNTMLTPIAAVILRLLGLTAFQIYPLVDRFRRLLVRRAFTQSRPTGIVIDRAIQFLPESVIITDTLRKNAAIMIREQVTGRKVYGVKMASANYFNPSELELGSSLVVDLDNLNRNGTATVTKTTTI